MRCQAMARLSHRQPRAHFIEQRCLLCSDHRWLALARYGLITVSPRITVTCRDLATYERWQLKRLVELHRRSPAIAQGVHRDY